MKRNHVLAIGLALTSLIVAGGCGQDDPDPNRGFDVQVFVVSNGVRFQQVAHVVGDFLSATGSTTGTVEHFDQNIGFATITGAKVPGNWRFSTTFNSCALIPVTLITERNVSRGQKVDLDCPSTISGSFTCSPDTVYSYAPPAIGTIYGQGIDATYGMPKVQYFDEYGTLIASETAVAVGGDGTWLQINIPDFSSAYTGSYTLVVKNKRADGSKYVIGAATVNVYALEPPPPDPEPDPCSCPPDLPCMPCQ